jgi:hypothetical protein
MSWHGQKPPPPRAPPERERPRRFFWCKIPNEFPDHPLLRAAALKARVPVHQAVAVALRLDCLANASEPRGSVADMNVTEFAASLQLRPDAVARIRAAFEDPDIFWIDQDFLTGFQARNPESEDHTAAERQRRRRAKLKAERHGSTGATGPPLIHSHVTSRRDSVTVTAREEKNKSSLAVSSEAARERARVAGDNSADKASATAAGPSEDGASGAAADADNAAALWLAGEGTRIVTEQLLENRDKAERLVARWRDQELGGDAAALAEIIRGAEKTGLFGATFLNLIVVGIRDAKRRAIAQGELRLPVLASERKMG